MVLCARYKIIYYLRFQKSRAALKTSKEQYTLKEKSPKSILFKENLNYEDKKPFFSKYGTKWNLELISR